MPCDQNYPVDSRTADFFPSRLTGRTSSSIVQCLDLQAAPSILSSLKHNHNLRIDVITLFRVSDPRPF